jgi:uracil-DNA glycosylase
MTAAPFVPRQKDLSHLVAAAAECRGCPLFLDTTQTVFGQGRRSARLILVGEQPGDVEDRRGKVFVGPAGRVLWGCVAEAGIDRTEVYATNAVKHFKHEDRGKRRIHKKPNTAEIEACHPWIDAELRVVRAAVIVALGAVAARSLTGRSIAIGASRGDDLEVDGRRLVITYHPSAVLRADDQADVIRAALVEDLRRASQLAGAGGPSTSAASSSGRAASRSRSVGAKASRAMVK